MELYPLLLSAVIAAACVLLTGPFFIPLLHKLKFGQSIREEGPKSHQAKSGTPTMGGVMIILGITVATLVAAPLTPEVLLALFIMLGHFVLGFLDDYIKVVKKRNLGLKARQKLLGQIIIAIVTMIVGTRMLGIDTTVWVPVLNMDVNIGWGYYLLVLFVLVGGSNAVNLTDGLDGPHTWDSPSSAWPLWVPVSASCASMRIRRRSSWAIRARWHSAVLLRLWVSLRIRRFCLP